MRAVFIKRRRLLATGLGLLASGRLARAHNGTVHVSIEKLAFLPAEIEARAGDVIEWINHDPFPHTATMKGGWEVIIPPGKAASRVATAGDSVDYYCRYHPNMRGRIRITG